MRERIILECTECGERNYMTTLNTKGGKKIEVKKFCPKHNKRTMHKSRKV
ncbi:MAG TPA: 50S ribosomal protein L33 [Planctomycetota bacterium]|nr:50S ribosomal protein L33 [Planctomycetota bacterium]